MRKIGLLIAALFFLNLFGLTYAFAWQGRMAGTGEAYGLFEDESDFLIHPAVIVSGQDLNIYGTYRFTYDYISQWDNEMVLPPPEPADDKYPYEAKGHDWKNDLMAGTAFSLGTGRMGLFFEYAGNRAKYDCEEYYYILLTTVYRKFKIESKSDKFNLRAIYSKPFGSIKLGGEILISHIDEENTNIMIDPGYLRNGYLSQPGADL
jgi:hypothetical protein